MDMLIRCAWQLACILLLISSKPLHANDLRLNELQLLTDHTVSVEISWDNAWNLEGLHGPGNHDAVWLFLKYMDVDGSWHHLQIIEARAIESRLAVKEVADQRGVFVKLAEVDSGRVEGALLELTLDRELQAAKSVQIFGIEMVYVPEGPFFVGDERSFNHILHQPDSSALMIENEGEILLSAIASSDLYAPHGDIPAAYPKGFAGFYMMKYEIGQEQYKDFLNTLSYRQQMLRTNLTASPQAKTFALANSQTATRRNGIYLWEAGQDPNVPHRFVCNAQDDPPDMASDGQNRACNQLTWDDVGAYLDWAALRPMTELEFEKAARGPEDPIPGGFAWGTPYAVDANTVLEDGTASEHVTEMATDSAGLASHGYLGLDGPLRAGFGGSATSDRLQIGGSYYGILELSGNLWELVVNLDSLGLRFEGRHGDGNLSSEGNFNEANWPRGAGAGHKGGALNSGIVGPYRDLAISDRFYIELYPDQRRNTTGGRGVRTAE